MTEKTIREIKFEKGSPSPLNLLSVLIKSGGEAIRKLKKSGRNLKIPITKR